jgi:hypothetical protein
MWASAMVLALALSACAGKEKESDAEKSGGEKKADSSLNEAANPQTPASDGAVADSLLPKTTIKFDKTKHDFGNIVEGDSAVYDFTFTNTGDKPLKITKVKPACGCTTPSYTKDLVAPGEKGFVRVKFDSNGRPGKANKDVTVFANTDPPAIKLSFTAEVEPKKK